VLAEPRSWYSMRRTPVVAEIGRQGPSVGPLRCQRSVRLVPRYLPLRLT
jgi:hypothetical protein